MSFVDLLRANRQTTTPSDPWAAAIRNLHTQSCHDGLVRISTDAVFDQLGVPPFQRTPAAAKRLRGLMILDGWTPVRARAITARGRAARVRGYVREPGHVEPRPHPIKP